MRIGPESMGARLENEPLDPNGKIINILSKVKDNLSEYVADAKKIPRILAIIAMIAPGCAPTAENKEQPASPQNIEIPQQAEPAQDQAQNNEERPEKPPREFVLSAKEAEKLRDKASKEAKRMKEEGYHVR